MFDLKVPENAYIFGLIQTDGHMSKASRNRGRLSIELSKQDENILYKIYDILKARTINSTIKYRTRSTNFSTEHNSVVLNVFNLKFRNVLENLGVPYGPKSTIISIPNCEFSELDYIRGIIDGDGSLGLTSNQLPFISLATASDSIAEYYKSIIEKYTGLKINCKRNKRDNIYNIVCRCENAQALCKIIYYNNCLSIDRKYLMSLKMLKWKRPTNMKKRTPIQFWDKDQDILIKNLPIQEAAKILGRTEKSIKCRLWRLDTERETESKHSA